jgi:hypothetical protein
MTTENHRRSEHLFFLACGFALLAIVVIGFAQSYFFKGVFLAPLPSALVHIHATLFVGWIFLFIAQVSLVTTGNVHWHRQLGALMAAWALLMVLVGPPTIVMALRRPGSGVGALEFFGDLGQILVFAVLVGRALLRRRDSPTHKRLMLGATAVLMLPALARWPMDPPLPVFLALYLAVPLALVVWDLATTRRVHRASVLGLASMIVLFACTVAASELQVWADFVHWVSTV